jgi:DNA helicase HerA-like ATPase
MIKDGKIWAGNTQNSENVFILPKMANRHGLIAGATGTGKTITVKVLAESFSDMGVPVFLADVKGDLAGTFAPGIDSEDMQKRIERFGLAEAGFTYTGYPVTIWDLFGTSGIQLRTTISEMGPLLLARIMGLNELQTDILTITFKIADDQGLLLVDTKDLKAMLNYVEENRKEFESDYGRISSTSVAAIVRSVVALEMAGGDVFFGEHALNIHDWFTMGPDGRGMINILDSGSLINNPKLYSTFLLWLMSEMFETLPEVGDPEKPKMVFFFDEAHLLFKDASKELLAKIEQVVKLIRSKGVGIYFCTQNPRDIPDDVLAQLGNKVEHALRAYTPKDQKAVRAAADSFRVNPEFDTYKTILELGTGQAVVSFLDEKGIPGIAQRVNILPPRSRMGTITEEERRSCITGSWLYGKYAETYDPDSAYEFLERRGLSIQAANEAALRAEEQERQQLEMQKAYEKEYKQKLAELERQAAAEQKARERELKEMQKAAEKAQREAQKQAEREAKERERLLKSIGGTLGREVGRKAGSGLGTVGKRIGSSLGNTLGRGIIGTLFKY